MSYTSPNINQGAEVKIGIDAPIEAIRLAMAEISWISKSFGRAMTFREVDTSTGKTLRVPKVYEDNGEYVNVLPNDNIFSDGVAASSFIRLLGSESYELYDPNTGSIKSAKLSIIVWADLKKIAAIDYIYTEYLKAEIESKIKKIHFVTELIEWFDERAEDVFQGYDLEASDFKTEYLMYPYAGIRLDLTVNYPESC
ncbi:MAG: hypothetical protein WCG90_08195 [Chitinophagia bacterium]